MKKLALLLTFGIVMLFITSCGHNAVVFGKGFGIRAGFDPEHFSADVNFIYGEQLTLAARDNIKIKLKTNVEGGQETSSKAVANADSILEIDIGQQINGYTVDAIKAGADTKDLIALNGNYPPTGKDEQKEDADAEEVKAAETPTETPAEPEKTE